MVMRRRPLMVMLVLHSAIAVTAHAGHGCGRRGRHADVAELALGEAGLLGQVVQHGARGVEHLDGVVEELGALGRHRQRPAVLAQPCLVELGLLVRGRRRPEQAAEGADQREVDLGCEVPEGLEVLGLQPVDEVHGGDEACLGGAAADVQQVGV